MMSFFIICAFIIVIYSLLIIAFIHGFNHLKKDNDKSEGKTKFSIIIPFRNEAKRLPELLNSVKELNYNLSSFEIILVDDESTDNSVTIINEFIERNKSLNIHIIKNYRTSNSPKKDAICTAINKAQHNWILTTDADVVLPKTWLKILDGFIFKNNPNMVVSPVGIKSSSSFLEQFQMIDFLSMQGSTIGSFGIHQPFMANGANLAYKKDLFLNLNGFIDNNTIASGDDVFILEKFLTENKEKVLFLKNIDALVYTFPVSSWKDLINQRKRWAAKATNFNNNFTKAIGLLVFAANTIIIFSFILFIFKPTFTLLILGKYLVDTLLISKTATLYKLSIHHGHYIKTLIFYPFFTVYIAISSMLSSFNWKGREFRA